MKRFFNRILGGNGRDELLGNCQQHDDVDRCGVGGGCSAGSSLHFQQKVLLHEP